MRRIFPTKSSATLSASEKHQQVKKDSSSSASSKRDRDAPKSKDKPFSRTRRDHWCPSERCETPPSGDENASTFSVNLTRDESESGNRGSISQSRLGLPEECQDKQVLRPSIKVGAAARSPSTEPFEWTSGLQDALDELVIDSRQELRRKYVSEPPSPSTSPLVHHVEAVVERSVTASSGEDDEREVSSGRLSHPVNLEDSDLVATVSHSMEFESSTSYAPSGKVSRSMSRSSSDGPSILSNPRSHSFSEWSRAPKTSENFTGSQQNQITSRDRSHFKYLSARVVAEKLAKAIRGNSKPKTEKQLPPIPQTPSRSCESSHSSTKVVRALVQPEEARIGHQNYFRDNDLAPKIQIDRRPKVEGDKSRGKLESGLYKQENEFFKRQLESHNAQINFVYENLSERVCSAEKLLTAAEGELKSSAGFQGEKNAGRLCSRELERQDTLLRRVKKLQKEKNELAREVVSEVRLRNMERLTVREVIELMKRDMEFWIKSLEQDKSEMQHRLQQLDVKGGNPWARDKVQKLAEEKTWLERELVAVTAKESALRQKVREFELQMQAHVSRVENAERTIVDLRESVVSGQKKMIELEEEGDQLRKGYREKESENVNLRKHVDRLQQLCSDHEKSIGGLWQSLNSLMHDKKPDQKVARLHQELLRMSETEQTLRRELEASRVEANGLRQELSRRAPEPESARMKATLQEHVSMLSTKLQESHEFQIRQQKEMHVLEAAKVLLEEQNECLQKKLEQRQTQENGSSGQQQIIDGLQQSLSDMNHALSTQNSRIQRLTSRNEELHKLYTSKEKELFELQSKAREDNESKRTNEDKHKQALQKELEAQRRQCNSLKDKLASTERDLDEFKAQLGETSQRQRALQEEAAHFRRLLESSTQRVVELEHQLKDREQKLGSANTELRQYWQELGKYKEELPRVIRQRDDMKQEAEELGREALRTSAEAEILRRRVHELEEEVMIRDGHLSILRGSLENANDDC